MHKQHIATALLGVVNGMRATTPGQTLSMAEGFVSVTDPERFANGRGALPGLEIVSNRLPDAGRPVTMEHARDGSLKVNMGGVVPRGLGHDDLEETVADLERIEQILPEHVRSTDANVYAFGREGRLNANTRECSVWARSPMEAVAKLYVHLKGGFGEAPLATLEADIHEGGRMEMRRMHDWAEFDVDDLAARLRDEVELQVLSEERDPETGPDFT